MRKKNEKNILLLTSFITIGMAGSIIAKFDTNDQMSSRTSIKSIVNTVKNPKKPFAASRIKNQTSSKNLLSRSKNNSKTRNIRHTDTADTYGDYKVSSSISPKEATLHSPLPQDSELLTFYRSINPKFKIMFDKLHHPSDKRYANRMKGLLKKVLEADKKIPNSGKTDYSSLRMDVSDDDFTLALRNAESEAGRERVQAESEALYARDYAIREFPGTYTPRLQYKVKENGDIYLQEIKREALVVKFDELK